MKIKFHDRAAMLDWESSFFPIQFCTKRPNANSFLTAMTSLHHARCIQLLGTQLVFEHIIFPSIPVWIMHPISY